MKKNKINVQQLLIVIFAVLIALSACKKDDNQDDNDDDTPTPPIQTCNSNITDGCLDDWQVIGTAPDTYIEPAGNFLQTLNELSILPPEIGGPGPVTADTVTDCTQGKYAAKLTSKIFSPMPGSDIFIPGYIGASILDIPASTIHLGKPYTQKPEKLQAYYKYLPANSDSAMILVMLTKYNTADSKRDTISYNKMILKNQISTYTQLNMELSYLNQSLTPDTLVLIFAASAGVNFNSLTDCYGQEGSVMWIDDLKFVLP